MSRTIFTHIKELAGVESEKEAIIRKSGEEMKNFPSISNAFLLIENEKIIDFGAMSNALPRADKEVNLKDKTILPAWCDSHTHIIYAQSREHEFVDRIKGLSYEEIAEKGGGILNSAKTLQQASEQQLYEGAKRRLQEVIGYGTGAIEIKSGYGLTVESELKMLRVAQRLKQESDAEIKVSFLGAHAFPMEYRNDHHAYIKLIEDEMLPQIKQEQLADYIDVFCDKGFFNVEETGYLLNLGAKYNLKGKIHANELDFSGGVQVGVEYNALSVDHLECTSDAEIQALKGSKTIGTVLPSTSFFLGIPYAPSRKMIDAGLPIAIASDYNPGSTPSGNIPFVLSLATIKMKLLPEEAMNGVTINGAYAMDLAHSHGSIKKGKIANFIITQPINSLAYIPYYFGSNHISEVYINGKKQNT